MNSVARCGILFIIICVFTSSAFAVMRPDPNMDWTIPLPKSDMTKVNELILRRTIINQVMQEYYDYLKKNDQYKVCGFLIKSFGPSPK